MTPRLEEFRDKSCGCRYQKDVFRDSVGYPISAWVVIEQCEEHKAENEALIKWFNEGGPNGDDYE